MALGPKGIDVRHSSGQLVFRASLKDTAGARVTSGTTSLYLYELQSDGTIKSYDFNDHTFKTTALTTETVSMTHRQGNNNTTNTGIWTYALSTLSGFTAGGVYIAVVSNTGAMPPQQEREFQFGGVEGDVNAIGDAVLLRDWATIAASVPDRSSLNAQRFLRNKWSISGSTLTVTKEDDSTTAWTSSLTTNASADPVTASDPA